MNKRMVEFVRQRAHLQCEYCRLPESVSELPHLLDHITARQHRGPTRAQNLALCCGRCNLSKGPNLTGIDPKTGKVTRLFNPRKEIWSTHFRWKGPVLVGLTAVGRTTVEVLAINEPHRVSARRILQSVGRLPLK